MADLGKKDRGWIKAQEVLQYFRICYHLSLSLSSCAHLFSFHYQTEMSKSANYFIIKANFRRLWKYRRQLVTLRGISFRISRINFESYLFGKTGSLDANNAKEKQPLPRVTLMRLINVFLCFAINLFPLLILKDNISGVGFKVCT